MERGGTERERERERERETEIGWNMMRRQGTICLNPSPDRHVQSPAQDEVVLSLTNSLGDYHF